MRKIFLTMCAYSDSDEMNTIFSNHIEPRFKMFCDKHNFEYHLIKENYSVNRSWSWSRLFYCKQIMPTLNDGDIITMMDADCLIVDGSTDAVWDADFSVALESTGVICAGLFSIKVSDWSRKFVDIICSDKLNNKYKDTHAWKTFGENDAVYHMLGLNWGDNPLTQIGTKIDTEVIDFTKEELLLHVNIIPVEWNVTVDPDDVINELDDTDKCLSKLYRSDLHKSIDETKVRHFGGGRIYKKDLTQRYYERAMKI